MTTQTLKTTDSQLADMCNAAHDALMARVDAGQMLDLYDQLRAGALRHYMNALRGQAFDPDMSAVRTFARRALSA